MLPILIKTKNAKKDLIWRNFGDGLKAFLLKNKIRKVNFLNALSDEFNY